MRCDVNDTADSVLGLPCAAVRFVRTARRKREARFVWRTLGCRGSRGPFVNHRGLEMHILQRQLSSTILYAPSGAFSGHPKIFLSLLLVHVYAHIRLGFFSAQAAYLCTYYASDMRGQPVHSAIACMLLFDTIRYSPSTFEQRVWACSNNSLLFSFEEYPFFLLLFSYAFYIVSIGRIGVFVFFSRRGNVLNSYRRILFCQHGICSSYR